MEVFGGGRAQRGRSGWDGPVGPPESLDNCRGFKACAATVCRDSFGAACCDSVLRQFWCSVLAAFVCRLSLNRLAHTPEISVNRRKPCPSFPCFFGKRQGKPPKKQGFSIPTEPLKSLKNAQKNKEILAGEKTKEFQKTRKGRTGKPLGKFRKRGEYGLGEYGFKHRTQ